MISLARAAIQTAFLNTEPKGFTDPFLNEKRGVFVTLYKDGELRGCIGFIEPIFTLREGIIRAARSAAFHDPRFPPLLKDELDTITIEISVMTVPTPVETDDPSTIPNKITIGQDGLIIRKYGHSGLLLPQVATEYSWDATTFLKHTCMKAGLPEDSWKHGAEVLTFQCEITRETQSNQHL